MRYPDEWRPGGPRPFLICALPRSRTAWVANWLTHGVVRCAHELCTVARAPEEIPALLRQAGGSFSGNADTAQALVLPRLLEALPGAALVVIRRDAEAVAASLEALGLREGRRGLQLLAESLERAARRPRTLVLEADDLESEAAARALLAHVAPGEPFDRARWAMLRGFNVQVTPRRLQDLLRGAERGAAEFLSHQT